MKFNYKLLSVIPVVILIAGAGILINGFQETGDWFLRSIDLKGGTIINLKGVFVSQEDLPGFNARIRNFGGFGGEGVIIEFPSEVDPQDVLDALEAKGISVRDASIQTVGPALGETFWRQTQIGIVIAFVMMGIVVFFLFRKIVPSIAVIFAAVSDILVTLALMQVFGIPLSLAGLAAVLMLIGYSVDTDILLTSRMLRGSGPLGERLRYALKTGLTMSLTTMGVLIVILVSGISPVITQIASVLFIGLVLDLVNTWFMNAVILMWYMKRRSF